MVKEDLKQEAVEEEDLKFNFYDDDDDDDDDYLFAVAGFVAVAACATVIDILDSDEELQEEIAELENKVKVVHRQLHRLTHSKRKHRDRTGTRDSRSLKKLK